MVRARRARRNRDKEAIAGILDLGREGREMSMSSRVSNFFLLYHVSSQRGASKQHCFEYDVKQHSA